MCAPHPPLPADAAVRAERLRPTGGRAAAPARRVWCPAPRSEDRQRTGGKSSTTGGEVGFGCSVKLAGGTTSATYRTGGFVVASSCSGCVNVFVSACLHVCAPTCAVAAACTRHDCRAPSPSPCHMCVCAADRDQLTSTRSWWHHWRGVLARRSSLDRVAVWWRQRLVTCSCWAAPSSRC